MPCFKGLAVSIHTPDGPLPEYSISKQQRQARIQSYIPVPTPKLNASTGRADPATFAISITLLTPGQPVPYSKPKETPDNPSPSPKIVGSMMPQDGARGKFMGIIGPYIPLTSSLNETVAAYIHFDGRAKEEVATLLRRGEETWVNSRWVGTEGNGLAEREFLFREVGLERWLNGLDLKGGTQEVAAKIERRKRRLEKKRRTKLENRDNSDDDEFDLSAQRPKRRTMDSVLRYGDDHEAPVEGLSDDDSMGSSDTDPEDDVPVPEAQGQIKVSLFRVLASGEVKKGEYSPQFDATDDDDMGEGGQGGDGSADVDHTTTFAKPKTLDPKSISTQTVTGIDPPNKPYATFTFFYRGKKQLQKMGILSSSRAADPVDTSAKKNKGLDTSSLKPLKSNKGTVGFTGYRDANAKPSAFGNGKKTDDDDDESEDEGGAAASRKRKSTVEDKEDAEEGNQNGKAVELSPEEASKQRELAYNIERMKLKRPSSSEALNSTATSFNSPSQNGASASGDATTTPPSSAHPDRQNSVKSTPLHKLSEPSETVGSPFKKARASLSNDEPPASSRSLNAFVAGNDKHPLASQTGGTATTSSNEPERKPEAGSTSVNGSATSTQAASQPASDAKDTMEEEEL